VVTPENKKSPLLVVANGDMNAKIASAFHAAHTSVVG
jgi:hypothetical protein